MRKWEDGMRNDLKKSWKVGDSMLKTNEIKLRSGATSLFDVQRWTFDVRRSSLKKI
jgi:hypothetical protein